MHTVYVYGTLRPGNTEEFLVPGTLYDLGWFPGISRDGDGVVICEKITVDDDGLRRLDFYEGYHEDDPKNSLYIRERHEDGWIYVYNQGFTSCDKVPSGDWLSYTGKSSGSNHHLALASAGQF